LPVPYFSYKLNEKKFLFHNVRLNPGAYAVEIYNLKGERTVECFDYIPYSMKSGYNELLTAQTVLTTDRRGYFYIGFQYPENPYRIWKYNENGLKVAVLGNYFEDPDIYEFPEEWLKWKATEIEYYGINRLYAVEKLLIDGQGRLFVVFSIDRISRKHRGEDTHKCFIDMYSEKGDFLDRFEFKYGIPQLIDQDIIYSRIETSPGSWKITVVRLSID